MCEVENRRILDCHERRNLQGKRVPKSWRSSAVERVRWLDTFILPKPVVAEDDGPKKRRARLNNEDFYKFGFTDQTLGLSSIHTKWKNSSTH